MLVVTLKVKKAKLPRLPVLRPQMPNPGRVVRLFAQIRCHASNRRKNGAQGPDSMGHEARDKALAVKGRPKRGQKEGAPRLRLWQRFAPFRRFCNVPTSWSTGLWPWPGKFISQVPALSRRGCKWPEGTAFPRQSTRATRPQNKELEVQ